MLDIENVYQYQLSDSARYNSMLIVIAIIIIFIIETFFDFDLIHFISISHTQNKLRRNIYIEQLSEAFPAYTSYYQLNTLWDYMQMPANSSLQSRLHRAFWKKFIGWSVALTQLRSKKLFCLHYHLE